MANSRLELQNWDSNIHTTIGGSDSKESASKIGDPGSILGSGRSPGEGNGSPLQCSCLENPMGRGAWQPAYNPWGRQESDTTEQQQQQTERNCITVLYTWN